ncbi:hypothetical protein ACRYCC_26515 [Actinomadura scrupuli]|uniref:hypothetical protein n=1 Tax=Actinomadura scrupuli TaxID=559629 RepID=UPI003D986C9D
MSEDSPAPWVSVRAVAWVLDEAPDVPANLLPTLVSLARHADADGRGCWLSKHRLGWNARKTEQQVKRDLKQLRDLGLIRLGDQRLVAHLPADKRPTVYDLAIEKRRKPYVPPAGGLAGTPVHRGASQGPSRGALEGQAGGLAGQSGGPSRAPKEGLEEDLEEGSLHASAERTIQESTGATEDETREILRRIIAKHDPASPAAYVRRMAAAGHLAAWLATLRAERPEPERPLVVRAGVECPHGELGGATLHPHTQLPVCPLCRAHVRLCEVDPLYCPECQAIREAAGLPPDLRALYDEVG